MQNMVDGYKGMDSSRYLKYKPPALQQFPKLCDENLLILQLLIILLSTILQQSINSINQS